MIALLFFQMKIYILVICLIFVHCQLPDQPPPKFALLTVTHARQNSYEIFLNYLKHYTETECYEKLISEICIIWNNQQLPDEIGALDRQLYWRMPVYFYLTKNNSLNHRFRAPKEANAEVFYSLDDDIMVDCDTLNNTYMHFWNAKQAQPGRFVSNQVRSFGYLLNKHSQFYYQGHSYANYFTISETGATFFPKHYLNLYYLQLDELELLRRKVDSITSCQDIFFMAISQHFYPEMLPEYYQPEKAYANTNPKFGLSRKQGLVPLRTSCLNYLTDIFGYNPLRLYNKNAEKYTRNWKFKNIGIIMQVKIRGLGNVGIIEAIENDFDQNQSIKMPLAGPVQQLQNHAQPQSKKEEQQHKQEPQTSQNSPFQSIQAPSPSSHEAKQIKQEETSSLNKDQPPEKKEDFSWLKYKFELLVGFLISVILLLIICVARLFRMYRDLKNKNNPSQHIIEQQQSPMHSDYS